LQSHRISRIRASFYDKFWAEQSKSMRMFFLNVPDAGEIQ
jgi:hypothetical protein